MKGSIEMKIIVDARGKLCPEPVIMTKKAVSERKAEDEIEVLVDNLLVVQNITKYAEKNSLSISYQEQADNSYVILIASSNKETSSLIADETMKADTNIEKDTVLIIHSKVLGSGDDTLGALLMKSYIYTLTKADSYPETILFYNGGVHLTTEGSESLSDLEYLVSCGVEILSCGTCLNHYGLTDSLRIGGITNMYTIVEKMTAAKKVITP